MAGELMLRPSSPCSMESLSCRGTLSPGRTPAAPQLQTPLPLLHPATQNPPVYLGLYLGNTGMKHLGELLANTNQKSEATSLC